MKILFFIESLHSGGKERQLVELLTYLNEKPEYELLVVLTKKDIHFEKFYELKIPYFIFERNFIKKDPIIFFKFFIICKKFNPDIIHTWGSMVTFYALPAKIFQKRKLLNFQIQDAPLSKSSIFKFDNIITKMNFFFSDLIVANSIRGLEAYSVKTKNAIVIYNGFVMDRLNKLVEKDKIRNKYKIRTRYLVVMVASYSKFKKNELFVDVANWVCRQRNDISFFSLGEGDMELFNVCNGKIENRERICLLGKIKDVESFVNTSDIGVLFTNGEGISNAIIEYMALGKPVVAHGEGGTAELVQHDCSGILLKNDSIEDISKIIISLIDNPNLRENMGDVGKKIINDNFTIAKMGMQFEKVYRSLLTI